MKLPYGGWTVHQLYAFAEAADIHRTRLAGDIINLIRLGVASLFDSKQVDNVVDRLKQYGRTREGNDPGNPD